MSPVRLVVRVTPRAGSDRIDGWAADAAGRPILKARTMAPPTDGRANAALEKLIARALGLAPSAVAVTGGHASRTKTLQIEGADEALLREKLDAPGGL
jgi:uncharacterized protein YggU (UPF0235/DUF167 family)